jgi:DNA-binding NarL/FixJ family response regulator
LSHRRILVVDDHPVTADGVCAVLRRALDPSDVKSVLTAAEALRIAPEFRPDVAVVDLNLPDQSGFDVVQALTAEHATRVVVFTMHDDDDYVLRATRVGAVGYVLKSDATTQLIEAVRAVAAGEEYFPAEVAAALLRQIARRANPRALTPREEQVTRLIASGLTNKEIGARLGLSVRTIETYRSRVMKKLDLHSIADLTRFAIAKGLLGASDDSP